jgi:hypothetical protein
MTSFPDLVCFKTNALRLHDIIALGKSENRARGEYGTTVKTQTRKTINAKFVPHMNTLGPAERVDYSSLVTCGRGQSFAIGRLNEPRNVLIFTTRILPSDPWCTSVMTAVGHCSGVLSSFRSTTPPGLRLGVGFSQR